MADIAQLEEQIVSLSLLKQQLWLRSSKSASVYRQQQRPQ